MFDRLDLLIGNENRKYLQEKTVAIVGLGGVGGQVVEALARSGIGHLILIDYDTVDISNQNRQLIASNNTIGKKKVEAFKNRISEMDNHCLVDIHDTFLTEDNITLLDGYHIDYLVDACDTISTKKAIIDKCIKEQIPFITSLGTGKRLDPTQLEITTLAKTSYDPIAKILRKYRKDNHIKNPITVLYSKEPPKKIASNNIASCYFVPNSAGILIASYVFNQLLKNKL